MRSTVKPKPRPTPTTPEQAYTLQPPKIKHEDSNASLISNTEHARNQTEEDSGYIQLQSLTSRRLPPRKSFSGQNSPEKTTPMKRSSSRLHNREESGVQIQGSIMESQTKSIQDYSNILGRTRGSQHNEIETFLKKGPSFPFSEISNGENQASFAAQDDKGNQDALPLPKVMEFTVRDYIEEQDIVHSLKNDNGIRKKPNSHNEIKSPQQEEIKDNLSSNINVNATGSRKWFPRRISIGSVHPYPSPSNSARVEAFSMTHTDPANPTEPADQESLAIGDLRHQNSELANLASSREQNMNRNQVQNQNQNGGGTRNENAQQQQANTAAVQSQPPAPTIQRPPARPLMTKHEAESYFRTRIALAFILSISSLFLWLMMKHNYASYGHGIIISFYFYFAYVSVERALFAYKYQRIRYRPWFKKENKLDALCSIGCLNALFLFHLRLYNVISVGEVAIIPLVITTSIHAYKSEFESNDKKIKILTRILYIIQVLLVTLQVDKYINFQWIFVFLLFMVFTGTVGSLCLIYFSFIFVLTYLIHACNYQDRTLTRKQLYIGIIWSTLYYGLGGIGALIITGIVSAFDPKEGPNALIIAALVSLGFNAFLTVYSVLAYKRLIRYKLYFNSENLLGLAPEEPAVIPKPVIGFEVEQKKSYFISLSSTYYLPLTRDFNAKSKTNIERIKTMFRESRLGKLSLKQQNEKEENPSKLVSKEMLQTYKENLDKKLENPFKKGQQETLNYKNVSKILKITTPRNTDMAPKFVLDEDSEKGYKLHMSVGHIEELEGVYSKPKQNIEGADEDEKLCYLCYANPPNCVLMNCGHGGFCYECALSAVKGKDECMECRTKVEAVHKIDMESKMSLIKTIEISTVKLTYPETVLPANPA